jgi:hypothetical protein
MKVKNYQELIVWQKAMDLVRRCLQSIQELPSRRNLCTHQPSQAGGCFYSVKYR